MYVHHVATYYVNLILQSLFSSPCNHSANCHILRITYIMCTFYLMMLRTTYVTYVYLA